MSQIEIIASEVVAASMGGAISASILYPLEVLKTKMQAHGSSGYENDDEDDNACTNKEKEGEAKSMVQFATQIYQKEGAGVFFHGVETSAFQSATEKALYFFAYTALKEIHFAITNSKLDGLSNLVLGCAAEWAHLPITLPLDCWTTQIQTSNEKPLVILLNLLEAGPSKMYKGIQAYTVLCLKPALQYTIFEQVKAVVVAGRSNKTLGAVEAFLLGMIARTVATVVVFPYLRAKVMLQTAKSTTSSSNNNNNDGDIHITAQQEQQKKQSILAMLGTMYSQKGLASWFQGLGPELTRGVLSAALMMMIKEKIAILVKKLLLGHPSRRQKRVKY